MRDRITGPRGQVLVYDERGIRRLCFAENPKLTQGAMYLDRPLAWRSEFVELMRAGLATAPPPKRVLLLGLGTGAMARLALASDPAVEVDAVEVDPAVVTAATRWFGVEPSARLRIHVDDAAAWLRKTEGGFDLAVVDCYDARRIPPHLGTQAFADRVAARARVVTTNLVRSHEGYAQVLGRWCRALRQPWRIEGVRSTNHVLVGSALGPVMFDAGRAEALGVAGVVARATPVRRMTG